MNFQDVIRESYDDSNKALKVNTVAGGSGQATVVISGVVNSITTIANTPLNTQIIGNVTLSGSLPAGVNNIGFATVAVSNPTLYAVVNTTAASGVETIFVGTPTLYAVVNTGAVNSSNVTLDAGSKTGIVGNVTIDSGNISLKGNVTLDDGSLVGLIAGNNNIGDVDVASIAAGVNWIGFATITPTTTTRSIAGNITIDSGVITTITNPVAIKGNITINSGTITAVTDITNPIAIKGNVTLSGSLPAGVNGIGFATVNLVNQPALVASTAYIGLVTAVSRNAGTTKTLIHKNIELSTSSIATVYVATETWKATNIILNSDATVRVSIKSGATYLTGNASIGITLMPGGGWVETGSPDSPTYIALAVDQGLVVEKFDLTATSAKVGGKIIFFDE